jgi:hypothetical protein
MLSHPYTIISFLVGGIIRLGLGIQILPLHLTCTAVCILNVVYQLYALKLVPMSAYDHSKVSQFIGMPERTET